MEKRDWEYWHERLKAANEGKAPALTDDEMLEMFAAGEPPGYTEEEKIRIRQHGTRREKFTLKYVEQLKAERDSARDEMLKQIEERKKKK